MTRNDATLAQTQAANPDVSTWLSANAGSGKTRVLIDRVSLLLLDGVNPERILCLTYTKAAASEMQNRLFARLGEWAMMPDPALREALTELKLDQRPPEEKQLSDARRLFARAVETPGGLKIQTIHSFCASLLRRFPLEADVSPNFSEMDSRQTRQLVDNVLEDIATEDPGIIESFGLHASGDDLQSIVLEILKNRTAFDAPFDQPQVCAQLGIPETLSEQDVLAEVFLGNEPDLIAATRTHLDVGGGGGATLAHNLASLPLDAANLGLLSILENLFLTGPNTKAPFTPKAHPPTKPVRESMGPALVEEFDAFRQRVADARERRVALAALEKAKALHAFAQVLIPRIDTEKALQGWLDFDDLILRTRDLLARSEAAAWVLFRLDGGIDHILVDEAQDTSPEQWDVVRLLADEFASGNSARPDVERTIFVVGDQKQSIYSFQGADPAGFTRMRDYFERAMEDVGKPFQKRELLHSFRSASAILSLVDTVFAGEAYGMGESVHHIAFKSDLPGRVDLWPWESASDNPEPSHWSDPVDVVGTNHHSVRLANRVAEFISDRLAHGQITEVGQNGTKTRSLRPGDFLILVQKRSVLFHEIIRACKERELPMAGADRLRIGGELGVKDLVALLSWIATPEDDLSLATILRSPIGGFSEAQLFDLAHGRNGVFLRQRFEEKKDAYPEVHEMLTDLRRQADYLRPYELLERALTRHDIRRKLVARLGAEAEDGIDALLDQAMEFERNNIPGLTAFLAWLTTEHVEIKRQLDSAGEQIRVMTVHGAKGLEAPVVILPETGNLRSQLRTEVLADPSGTHWRARSHEMPGVQKALVETLERKQSEERSRLLYVAMTRAESWLVVCGGGDDPIAEKGAWYSRIKTALENSGAVAEGQALRLQSGDWPDDTPKASTPEAAPKPDLPRWLYTPPVQAPGREVPLSPSALGGDKVLAGETSPEALSEEDAKARGTAIHLSLEYLPHMPRDRWDLALQDLFPGHDQADRDELARLTERLTQDDALAPVFAPESLTEVAITAELDALDGARISGAIDRLLVSDDSVLAVDFKSNRIVPETPEEVPNGLLRQMGAYAAALSTIYPNHRIETAILWTETATLMRLPHDIVSAALLCTHTS